MVAGLLRLVRGGARDFLSIYDVDESIAAEFRVQQIRAIQQLTALTITANLFNVGVVVYTFRNAGRGVALALWALAVVAMMAWAAGAWLRTRAGAVPRQVSRGALKRATLHAELLAMLWVVPALMFYTRDDLSAALVTATISAGMLCAGGFVLLTVPSAAVSYVLTLAAGLAVALLVDGGARNADLLVLLSVYVMIVLGSVGASARNYGARLMAEAEAERQRQLMSLLLDDFEEHSNDWLWETDAAGRLVHVSARLVQTVGKPAALLRSRPLVELLDCECLEPDCESRSALSEFAQCMARPQPFRNVPVAVRTRQGRRWWGMTGKPLFDEQGRHAGWRGVGSDVTESRLASAAMANLARFDPLTKLANRHHFREELDRVGDGGNGQARECALLFFDLDDFKVVNDSLGHAAGDRVLQVVAQRMLARVRSTDVLARLGGDEFALIGWGVRSEEHAAGLARHLLEVFRQPFEIDGMSVQVSSSVGITLAPQHSSDPETLLRNADMALYAAKTAGRNTWRFFEPDMDERARNRLTLRNDLVAAIARQEFELYFQPQYRLDGKGICGSEALLRWHHPTRGRVSPGDFVPLAEDTGLILEIGRWVLRTACRTAAGWPEDQRVAVNVSAVQFARSNMVAEVRTALALAGLAADRLELEVTESVLIGDSDMVLETLGELRSLGVRIALDDFGTGYSSLAYLRNFPLTKLKIDRSFVSGMGRKEGDTDAIVRAIVALAAALDLETTAEGVESEAEHRALRGKGCTFGQGYYYARPMPAARIAALLDADREHAQSVRAS